jgi:hypothetical protein
MLANDDLPIVVLLLANQHRCITHTLRRMPKPHIPSKANRQQLRGLFCIAAGIIVFSRQFSLPAALYLVLDVDLPNPQACGRLFQLHAKPNRIDPIQPDQFADLNDEQSAIAVIMQRLYEGDVLAREPDCCHVMIPM